MIGANLAWAAGNPITGLFDKPRGNKAISLSPQAALLLSAIAMLFIDGDVHDDKIAVIRRLDGSGRTNAWDQAVKTWKTRTVDECIRLAARAMNSEQKSVAVANMVDIALADGILAGAEERLLKECARAFGISESFIENIVYVISIKNTKSAF